MRRLGLLSLLAVGLLAGCKSSGARPNVDGSSTSDTGTTGTDTSGDTGSALAPCLETPTELPRPPTGRLPCDLIPPGLRL